MVNALDNLIIDSIAEQLTEALVAISNNINELILKKSSFDA